PLQYQPSDEEPTGTLVVHRPHAEAKALQVRQWPFVYTDTREPGVYRLTTPGGRTIYYVVQPDLRDTEDLTPWDEQDRAQLGELLAMTFTDDPVRILASSVRIHALWTAFLIAAMALLCAETWLAQRVAGGNEQPETASLVPRLRLGTHGGEA